MSGIGNMSWVTFFTVIQEESYSLAAERSRNSFARVEVGRLIKIGRDHGMQEYEMTKFLVFSATSTFRQTSQLQLLYNLNSTDARMELQHPSWASAELGSQCRYRHLLAQQIKNWAEIY